MSFVSNYKYLHWLWRSYFEHKWSCILSNYFTHNQRKSHGLHTMNQPVPRCFPLPRIIMINSETQVEMITLTEILPIQGNGCHIFIREEEIQFQEKTYWRPLMAYWINFRFSWTNISQTIPEVFKASRCNNLPCNTHKKR